jgi:hypothetical protein
VHRLDVALIQNIAVTMEPTDAAELISEIREEMQENREQQQAEDRFRNLTALIISVMAVILAVAGLGGDNVGEDMVHNNIAASDTWAFYQAKNVRQTSFRLAADELEMVLAANAGMPAEVRQRMEERIASYRATVARYDDEPDPSAPGDTLRGEGKKQLAARARFHEAARERAGEQDNNFDYGSILLQIAIVLGSVSLLASSRKLMAFAVLMAFGGVLLTVNGFLLLF